MHPISAQAWLVATKALAPSHLLVAVGAAVGGRSATAQICGTWSPRRGHSNRGWLASVVSASPTTPSSKTRTAPHRTLHPGAYPSTQATANLSIADLGLCDPRPRYGPRLKTRTSKSRRPTCGPLPCTRASIQQHHFFVTRTAMNHESSQPWGRTSHDDAMVATSSADDFTNFLELDFQIFDGTSSLEDGQPGLDTPMGDLGMDQLGMGGSMGDGATAGMEQNEMDSHPMSMAPTHAYVKSADAMDSSMHTQLTHHQHEHGRMVQNQNFQRQYMMPLTPHSSEMRGTAATYQHHMDNQGQVVYDRGLVSWTPLVSPAFSIPEYTVPGEYFSPLTSPLLQPHHQNTYPSAPSSDTGPTGSPIDLHLDTSKATAASQPAVRKSGRKSSISNRTPGRSARQSPLAKSQSRRKPNSINTSSANLATVASSHELGANPAPLRRKPLGSSDGSGPDSVSPEPLTDILMPPPSIPRSAGRSPNIQAQSKSAPNNNEPATPSTLLMRQDKSQTQLSPRIDQDVTMSAVEDSDFMLPEAATSARPALGIDTGKSNDDDQSTPTLSAKTPKLSANSTPRHTLMSPEIQSPRTAATQKQGESKPGSRSTKKRQSSSSAQISPMLVPKISPSIKPLMPSSGLYSTEFCVHKLTISQARAFQLSQLMRLHYILPLSQTTRIFSKALIYPEYPTQKHSQKI
jgi:hypothetical protein